jgi:hypothetical protein
MSRLFAFGCSFTNYRWSTWADCLAPEFDSFENWGQSGGGNNYIMNSVMEADQRNHFGQGDTVVVCWTSHMRDDRYANGKWHTIGNIFNCPIYNTSYLKSHVDDRGYMIRDMAYIKAVKTLLESKPGLDWKFISMVTYDSIELYADVFSLYQDCVDAIPKGYDQVLFANGWPNRDGDPHPSPAEHLAYLDEVLPGWVTKQSTRVIMQEESIDLNKDPRKSGMTKVTRL